MNDVGVIAIGRNEGERLRRCLASVTGPGMPVVYVDSASTDGSAALARSMGADVVELDMSLPFSAARARNEGFERLMRVAPATRLVQFVDGDCEVVDGWIERAARELAARADVAVVCGRRRERFPEKSIYNRLADVEWETPVGEAKSCGGDAMMRVEAFRSVGGFDPSVVAGEEPELCQRLREKGHKVVRVDAEMTLHDSDILRFGQWWKRAVRSGYGGLDVARRFRRGTDGLFVRQVRSARVWGFGWPAAVVLGGATAWPTAGGFAAAIVTLLIALLLPLQMARLAIRYRTRVSGWSTAVGYGVLTMLGKWASLIGQVRYLRDRSAGRHARLIEYKGCATPITKPT
jgi:GT2 family glycosyltransferase